jgi:hypothetical protein
MENEFQRLTVCVPPFPPLECGFTFSHSLLVMVLMSSPATPAMLLNTRKCAYLVNLSRRLIYHAVPI